MRKGARLGLLEWVGMEASEPGSLESRAVVGAACLLCWLCCVVLCCIVDAAAASGW
jgi:hypothetical protein